MARKKPSRAVRSKAKKLRGGSPSAVGSRAPDEPRMPWERAHGESDQAFEAFKAYRDMGLERSLPKAAAEVRKSVRLVHRWSAEWKWRERVEAWDIEQDRIERQRNLVEVRKMRKRHADAGMLLLDKALERLADIKSSALRVGALLKFIELGAKLEARARGEPEEHTQHDIAAAPGQKIVQSFTICGKTIEF